MCSLRECTVDADVLPVHSIPSLYPGTGHTHLYISRCHLTIPWDITNFFSCSLLCKIAVTTHIRCHWHSSFPSYLCTAWVTLVDIHSFPLMRAHLFSINRPFFDSRLIILVTLSFLWGLFTMYDHSSTGPVATSCSLRAMKLVGRH